MDPAHRMTASEVPHSSWLRGELNPLAENPKNVLEMMKKFAEETKNNNSTDSETDDFSEVNKKGFGKEEL